MSAGHFSLTGLAAIASLAPWLPMYGQALDGYGGVANYVVKRPTDETFATGIATLGSFGVRRLTFDVNAPLSDSKYLLFRITGSTQTVGSFVDFVHRRGFDIAPALDV